MLFILSKNEKTGIYYFFDYKGLSSVFKNGLSRKEGMEAYNFKFHGTLSENLKIAINCLKEFFNADTAVGIPPSGTHENNIQKICDRDIYLQPTYGRPRKHKAGGRINEEMEFDRIMVTMRKPGNQYKKIILADDIATTGKTIDLYRRIITTKTEIGDVVPVVVGHKSGPSGKKVYIFIKEIEEPPAKNIDLGNLEAWNMEDKKL